MRKRTSKRKKNAKEATSGGKVGDSEVTRWKRRKEKTMEELQREMRGDRSTE